MGCMGGRIREGEKRDSQASGNRKIAETFITLRDILE